MQSKKAEYSVEKNAAFLVRMSRFYFAVAVIEQLGFNYLGVPDIASHQSYPCLSCGA